MMGDTHFLSGAATWVGGCGLIAHTGLVDPGLAVSLGGAILCAVGALGPDIDHPRSTISRIGGVVTGALSWLVRCAAGHRDATHYGITAVVAGLVSGLLVCLADPSCWWVGAAVGAGWLVHILGDALTPEGVPLWGPWSRRRVRVLGLVRTGGRVEVLVRGVLWVGLVVGVVGVA